jgi:hypothetical protein
MESFSSCVKFEVLAIVFLRIHVFSSCYICFIVEESSLTA